AVHGERDHAVDVRRREAGIVEGRLHRLGGQAQLRAPRVLRELRRTDPGDGRLACERHDGSTRVTVPVTWSPRLFSPLISTSTKPLSPLDFTRPVISMVSSG